MLNPWLPMPDQNHLDNEPVKADDSRVRNSFNLIVTASSSFGMAAMGAFLCSVKQVNPSIVTRIDAVSVIGFVVPGVLTWFFCKSLLPATDEAHALDPSKTRSRRRWLIFFTAFTVLGMLTSVGFSLRNISSGPLKQIMLGAVCATIVLSIVGFCSWSLFRALEKDGESLKDGECEPGDLQK